MLLGAVDVLECFLFHDPHRTLPAFPISTFEFHIVEVPVDDIVIQTCRDRAGVPKLGYYGSEVEQVRLVFFPQLHIWFWVILGAMKELDLRELFRRRPSPIQKGNGLFQFFTTDASRDW